MKHIKGLYLEIDKKESMIIIIVGITTSILLSFFSESFTISNGVVFVVTLIVVPTVFRYKNKLKRVKEKKNEK